MRVIICDFLTTRDGMSRCLIAGELKIYIIQDQLNSSTNYGEIDQLGLSIEVNFYYILWQVKLQARLRSCSLSTLTLERSSDFNSSPHYYEELFARNFNMTNYCRIGNAAERLAYADEN